MVFAVIRLGPHDRTRPDRFGRYYPYDRSPAVAWLIAGCGPRGWVYYRDAAYPGIHALTWWALACRGRPLLIPGDGRVVLVRPVLRLPR